MIGKDLRGVRKMSRPKFLMEASIEELEEELNRKKKLTKPLLALDPDFTAIQKMVQELVDSVDNGLGVPKDFKQYLYEVVVEAYLGKGAWEWIHSRPV
jgi:hypothetical protein